MAIDELSRNRRIGVLLICCMSLFIVGLDITVVNVALPSIGQELHAGISGLQWTVGAYTVVMASLLDVLGLDGGPVRPQAHLRHRTHRVLGGIAAVQPGAERRAPRGVPRASGGGRLDDEPGRHVDHHQHLHGPARAGSGGGRLGRRVRHLDGARADRRRHARLRRSAGGRSSDQHSHRARRDPPDAPLHPRVEGAEAAPVRSRRSGPGDRAAGRADLRHHRSPEPGMVLGGHPGRVLGVGGGARWACSSTSPVGRSPSSTCGSSGRSRSRRRSSSRWPRSPRSGGSSSSTRSTSRTSAASRRYRPGSPPCRWPS